MTKVGDPDEPMASFHSAKLKVAWADRQLRHIRQVAETYVASLNQDAGLNLDGLAGFHGSSIHPLFPCHVGDAIFSLRSALDCCWMGLQRSRDANASKGTLPRAETELALRSAIEPIGLFREIPNLEGFILSEVRPFRDGNEVIWFAAQLDNWNKHNMLLITFPASKVRFIELQRQGEIGTVTFQDCVFEGVVPGGMISSNKPLKVVDGTTVDVRTDMLISSRRPPDERPLLPFLDELWAQTSSLVKRFSEEFSSQ